MAAEWRLLGEFVSLVSGNTPSKSNPDFWGGVMPWVSAKDMSDFWLEDSEDHLTTVGVEQASRVVPAGTTLMLTRGMTLHNRVPICRVSKDATFNQDVKAVLPRDGLLPRFLPYLLVGNHRRLHERVDSAGHGTGRLNTDEILSLPVYVPKLAEQSAIADFAESLDERIHNLRQTNATLEAIATALFKSWFVDFDGHAPRDMQESELGFIPKGWRWVSVSELIQFNPPEPLRKGTLALYLDMAAIPTTGSWPEPPEPREFGSGMRFRNGDTLLARITPCLENGKTAFVQCLPDDALAWGSTEFIVMRPKEPVPAEYVYLLARDSAFREHAIQSMTGTSGRQRVQADSVAEFKVASPPDAKIWQAFADFVAPLFKGIEANSEASQTLAQLRGTLLPRLISGELRVRAPSTSWRW